MIIAATGHRPDKLGGYSYKADQQLISLALVYLEEFQPEKVITGMALGWDTGFAIAAYCLGIPFIAAIPFEGQHLRWEQGHIRRYNEILSNAAEVKVVSSGGYSPQAMEIRNRWMVRHADRIAALWDGSSGGTGNCVRWATKRGKPIDQLWTRWATGRYDLDLLV